MNARELTRDHGMRIRPLPPLALIPALMRFPVAAWRWLRRQEVRFYLWELRHHIRDLEANNMHHLVPDRRRDERYRVVQLATLEPPLRQHYSPPWRWANHARACIVIACSVFIGWLAAQGG